MAGESRWLVNAAPPTTRGWFSAHGRTVTLTVEGIIIIAALLVLGYRVEWSGFEGRTVWDWLELFLVPLALAWVAFFFRRQESQNEQLIAEQARQSDQQIAEDRLRASTLTRSRTESRTCYWIGARAA